MNQNRFIMSGFADKHCSAYILSMNAGVDKPATFYLTNGNKQLFFFLENFRSSGGAKIVFAFIRICFFNNRTDDENSETVHETLSRGAIYVWLV